MPRTMTTMTDDGASGFGGGGKRGATQLVLAEEGGAIGSEPSLNGREDAPGRCPRQAAKAPWTRLSGTSRPDSTPSPAGPLITPPPGDPPSVSPSLLNTKKGETRLRMTYLTTILELAIFALCPSFLPLSSPSLGSHPRFFTRPLVMCTARLAVTKRQGGVFRVEGIVNGAVTPGGDSETATLSSAGRRRACHRRAPAQEGSDARPLVPAARRLGLGHGRRPSRV